MANFGEGRGRGAGQGPRPLPEKERSGWWVWIGLGILVVALLAGLILLARLAAQRLDVPKRSIPSAEVTPPPPQGPRPRPAPPPDTDIGNFPAVPRTVPSEQEPSPPKRTQGPVPFAPPAGPRWTTFDREALIEVIRKRVRESSLRDLDVVTAMKKPGLVDQLFQLAGEASGTQIGREFVTYLAQPGGRMSSRSYSDALEANQAYWQKAFGERLHKTLAPFKEAVDQHREGPELDSHWRQWKETVAPALVYMNVEMISSSQALDMLRGRYGESKVRNRPPRPSPEAEKAARKP
ncbi:MAG: hypothetical protein HYY13_09780 [Nitrospirae bacterium]|nr:hypothetical protein [Nitrospirota bacterium]